MNSSWLPTLLLQQTMQAFRVKFTPTTANITGLPESRCVSLIIDEMKIKEGLVYNKHTGDIIGLTDPEDVNNQLVQEC